MYLLMAKIVYKHEIAINVLSTFGLWFLMMHMQFFIVEERIFADWAYSILFPGHFLSAGWKIFGFCRVSLLPVVFEGWVVW